MKHLVQRFILAAVLFAGLVPAFAQAPSPVPALPDAERRTSYAITASTCACSLGSNLALYGDGTDYQNWVEVWLNGTQLQYNDPVFGWTITSPSGPIGNLARPITNAVLTFNNPQTGTVQIVGARRPRRVSQFNENAGVSARNLNQVITDIVAMLREAWDKINDVTGRVILAPPGETMPPLPPAAQRANQVLCFNSSGAPTPCAITSSGSIAAGNGILVSGSNPATITNDIQGSGPILVTGTKPLTISCPTCTAASGGATFIPSRATAQTLNLSAYNVVVTGGYGQPGDGGGATFKNVGTAPFIDSFIPTGTGGGAITNQGSGCTNGTYYGVSPTGGTGFGLQGIVVVSSGILTSFTVTGVGGNAYSINDILTIPSAIVPCTTQPTWKVASTSTPSGSFTDSVGDHFQIVVDQGNFINTRQFGAVINWTEAGRDAGATNDQPSVQNAIGFCAYGNGTTDAGGYAGCTVIQPAGTSLVCNGLLIPTNVILKGVAETASNLKECDSDASSIDFITLGDPQNRQTAFFSGIHDLTLFGTTSSACGSCAMVFSNSVQGDMIRNVQIYPITRGCVSTMTGWGGPGLEHVYNMYCVPNTSLSPFGVAMSGAAEVLIDGGSWFSVGGAQWPGTAILANQPNVTTVVSDAHCENLATCVDDAMTSGAGMVHVRALSGNATVSIMVDHHNGAVANNLKVEELYGNGSACTVFNGGSCVVTGNQLADAVY
jgi:hypothetical protein